MENVAVSLDPKNLRLFTFDLKGSLSRKNELKKGKVLKCMNFVEINSSKKKLIRLDTDQIERISEILEQDCQYLQREGLMDYSMLLDVEQMTSQAQNAVRFDNLRRSEWKSYDYAMIYHIGIIDFLQSWNISKKAENYYKTKMKLTP